MKVTVRRLAATISAALTVAGLCAFTAPTAAAAAPYPQSSRIGATNPFDRSAAIAERFGSAGAVIVANGDAYKQGADALAASFLAGAVQGPIVLTSAGVVSASTIAAARTVLSGAARPTLYVVGGPDAVSDQVANAIAAGAGTNVAVKRVSGPNRYATAAAVVRAVGTAAGAVGLTGSATKLPTAILASGEVNADAVAAGALSAAWHLPVLLGTARALPAETTQAIRDAGIRQLIVLGGPTRIPEADLAQARAAGVTTTSRIAGADRYETSAQLYAAARTKMTNAAGAHYGTGSSTVYLANGLTGFTDALSAGPLAAENQDSLATVPASSLPASVAGFLTAAAPRSVVALGAVASVTDSVVQAAVAAAAGVSAQQATMSSFDARMLQLMNQARSGAGLGVLNYSQSLTDIARYWSTSMLGGKTGGQLAHNPDLDSMVAARIPRISAWGENVAIFTAGAFSADTIFNAYMNSPGHRANIMNPRYAYVGVVTACPASGSCFNTEDFGSSG